MRLGRSSRSALMWTLASAWFLALLAGVAAAVLLVTAGDLSCERGDSNYGHRDWALLPPGPHCVWTVAENGIAAESGPGWQPSAYLGFLGLSAAGLVVLGRRFDRADAAERPISTG